MGSGEYKHIFGALAEALINLFLKVKFLNRNKIELTFDDNSCKNSDKFFLIDEPDLVIQLGTCLDHRSFVCKITLTLFYIDHLTFRHPELQVELR